MSDLSSWKSAAWMLQRYLTQPARLEHLLEKLPSGLDAGSRRRAGALLYGVIRNLGLLEKGLAAFVKKKPKPGLRASLLLASYELLAEPEKRAQIVDHAVSQIGRQYSRGEKGLANAVLRKMPEYLIELSEIEVADPETLAWRHGHPLWLVERWIGQFGFDSTRKFLEWNQREPQLYGRWQGAERDCAFLEATQWRDFLKVTHGSWEGLGTLLESGAFYLQNPGTRMAPQMIADSFSKGRVLDICAAPGGKSLLLDRLLGVDCSEIVSVDLPGRRFERMAGNFERCGSRRIRALSRDIFELDSRVDGRFSAVLLDVPCSNTGVMQRRLDARWRLDEARIRELVQLQLRMLKAAAPLVEDSGLLLYSTCSVDRSENEELASAFLDSDEGRAFALKESRVSYPWETGHDGSGAFMLVRS